MGTNNLWAGAVEGAVSKVVPKLHAKFTGTGSYTGEPGHTRVSHSKDEIRNDGNGPTRDSDTVTARATLPGPAATLLARLRRNSFNVHVTADTEATGKNGKRSRPGGGGRPSHSQYRLPVQAYFGLRCETAMAAQHGCWKSSAEWYVTTLYVKTTLYVSLLSPRTSACRAAARSNPLTNPVTHGI